MYFLYDPCTIFPNFSGLLVFGRGVATEIEKWLGTAQVASWFS